MDIDEKTLVETITRAVKDELLRRGGQNGVSPKEVVIGVGPAFGAALTKTLSGLRHADVIKEIRAGIEEEGLSSRVVKIYSTSDVGFIGKAAAEISGSGVGVGLQSKGTAVIHQKDLYPLSNLELFAQAPLIKPEHYRQLGKNAAKYAKDEKTTPVNIGNDPMVRPKYQVKAAIMHMKETEHIQKDVCAEAFDI